MGPPARRHPQDFTEHPWPDDASAILGEIVDIHLSYRGALPGSSDRHTRVKMKDRLRSHFNRQLWQLVNQEPRFRPEFDVARFAQLRGQRLVSSETTPPEASLVVEVGGRVFLPIVDRRRSLVCHLDITLLRREPPGAIVHGGDLDNRLKTLLDSLRIPQAAGEVPEHDPQGPIPGGSPTTLCLLEDDALITHLTIKTDLLLEPPEPGEKAGYVDLRVVASILSRSGSTHWLGQP